jgi:hypothetical protein
MKLDQLSYILAREANLSSLSCCIRLWDWLFGLLGIVSWDEISRRLSCISFWYSFLGSRTMQLQLPNPCLINL